MFLITGAKGQLGSELRSLLGNEAVYIDRDKLDITDEDAVKDFFAANSFNFIINTAGYTAVDEAEVDAERAANVNICGVHHLAKYGKRIIHISTDYVFDGKSYCPYTETDKCNPISVYGHTKLAGEEVALNEAETAVIIRTSWLYSAYGKNFVKTMLNLGQNKNEISVVFDQIGTPTWAHDLAQVIADILPQIKKGSKEIYHYSNEGVCSWYDFAVEIMEAAHLDCRVLPIESDEYHAAAARPHYSVLNKNKIKKEFNLTIPHWKESLKKCLKQF